MTLSLLLDQVIDITPEIREFVLRPAAGGTLPSYVAGSHIVVTCGEQRNAYSLTGDGTLPDRYTIAVRHCPDGKGGSAWMHGLRPGHMLDATPPRTPSRPSPAPGTIC